MVAEPEPTKKRRTKAELQTEKKDAAALAASKLLSTLEQGAVAVVGDAGEIQPLEHSLIDDPLAEMLARANPKKMDKYAGLISAISLAAGLVMYSQRVGTAYREQHPTKPRARAVPPMPQPGAEYTDAHLDELLAQPIPHGSTL